MLLVSFTLAIAVALAPTEASPVSPATTSVEVTRARAKEQLKQGRDLAGAAATLESLWSALRDPTDLYNAAIARMALGHYVVAFVHLRRLEGSAGLPPQASVTQDLDELRRQSTPLRVSVSPADAAASGTLVLERADVVGGPRVEVEATLVKADHPGTLELWAEAGVWRVSLIAPGRMPAEGQVVLQSGQPGVVHLTLRPAKIGVTIEVGPPEAIAAGASLRLLREGEEEPALVTTATASNHLEVDPGLYRLEVFAPGFVTLARDEAIDSSTQTLRASLQGSPPGEPHLDDAARAERRAERGVAVAAGIVGVALIGTGVGTYVGARQELTTLQDSLREELNTGLATTATLAWHSNVAGRLTYGAALLGSGAGVWIAGATGAFSRRDLPLVLEAGVGLGILVAGALGVDSTRTCAASSEETLDELQACRVNSQLAGAATGLGSGLVVSSLAGELARLTARRRGHVRGSARLSLTAGRTGAGAFFRGSF